MEWRHVLLLQLSSRKPPALQETLWYPAWLSVSFVIPIEVNGEETASEAKLPLTKELMLSN